MKASIEISMYPLNKDYEKHIIDFIKQVEKNPALEMKVNGMSTQVFGDYHELMKTLTKEVYEAFTKAGDTVFVMKILNAEAKEAKID